MLIQFYRRIKFSLKKKITFIRYQLIIKLVGDMPIIANAKVSNYDFESNFSDISFRGVPYMYFNNTIYRLENLIYEKVYAGRDCEVTRQGNMFVLRKL